jgi:hypothetical protein
VSTQEAGQDGIAESGAPGTPEEREASAPGPQGAPGAPGQPSEAELRAAYEAELSRITSAEVVLQATVSLLNLGTRRLGLVGGAGGADSAAGTGSPPPERDLEQVRDAIDAVRGLMGVIERRAPREARPLRDALSQLQMAYAREARAVPGAQPAGDRPGAPAAGPSSTPTTAPPGAPATPPPVPGTPAGEAGPAESSGRLWVPGR